MFLLKKFVASLITPPGLFIILLIIGAFLNRRHKGKMAILLLLSFGLYLTSIGPVANLLLSPIENQYSIPFLDDLRTTDAYVVLGGGTNDKGVDIFGQGTLSNDSTARLIAAYRLYRMVHKPIIITGGPAYPGRVPESEIEKRFLVKLGVRNDHVMTEIKSRDTYENAIHTKELCVDRGISRIVLVTSAYHLKRAMLLFSPLFSDVTPCPAGFRTSPDEIRLRDFFPSADSLHSVSIASRERLGILFYEVKFWRENWTKTKTMK